MTTSKCLFEFQKGELRKPYVWFQQKMIDGGKTGCKTGNELDFVVNSPSQI